MSEYKAVERKIMEIVESGRASKGSELVEIVVNEMNISEEDAINTIFELEDKEKILFLDIDKHVPDDLQKYLLSSYAYWYWAVITISLLTIFSVFLFQTGTSNLNYARYVLGSVNVLFLPGYCVVKIVFLGEDITTNRQILYSIGVSVSLISILGLIMNYSPWGLHPAPLAIIEFLVILALSTIGIIREFNDKLI